MSTIPRHIMKNDSSPKEDLQTSKHLFLERFYKRTSGLEFDIYFYEVNVFNSMKLIMVLSEFLLRTSKTVLQYTIILLKILII